MGKPALHIAIVGYGTAGQTAAILLTRDGHHVEVFEQASQLGPVGAGFLLQPVGLHVLWELGLLKAALGHGRRFERLYGETCTGRAVMDMRYADLDARVFGLGMQRGALFSLLAAARTHAGRTRTDVARAERFAARDVRKIAIAGNFLFCDQASNTNFDCLEPRVWVRH